MLSVLDMCVKVQIRLCVVVMTPCSIPEFRVVRQWLELVSCCLWGSDFYFKKVLSKQIFLAINKAVVCQCAKCNKAGCFFTFLSESA